MRTPGTIWGTLSNQKHLPCIKFRFTQATQRDPDFVKRCQMCFKLAALFQSSSLFNPSPPSLLGTQTESQETLALAEQFSVPFHKKPVEFLFYCSNHLLR